MLLSLPKQTHMLYCRNRSSKPNIPDIALMCLSNILKPVPSRALPGIKLLFLSQLFLFSFITALNSYRIRLAWVGGHNNLLPT